MLRTLAPVMVLAILIGGCGAPSSEESLQPLAASDDCAVGDLLHLERPPVGGPELRLVAIDRAPEGRATVHLDRHALTVLVLSAAEPTDWTVELEEGSVLAAVVLDGAPGSRVAVPAGVAVEDHTGPGSGDPMARIARAEAATRLPLASYRGCPVGSEFGIYSAE